MVDEGTQLDNTYSDTGPLFQFQVSAMGTEGEVITSIEAPNLTGNVHNVSSPNFGTPGAGQAAIVDMTRPAPYPAEWVDYDTFFKVPAQTLGSIGLLTEGELTRNTDELGLPQFNDFSAGDSGFAPLTSGTGGDTWNFSRTAANQSSEWNFLQVVTTQGTANLDISVIATPAGGGDAFSTPLSVAIGEDDGGEAPILATDVLIDEVDGRISNVLTGMLENTGGPADTWTLGEPVFTVDPAYPGGGDGPANPASIDESTGEFSWDPVGSPLGLYEWPVTAANASGEATGTFAVRVTVPEPASMGLVGLAVAGVMGFARRRFC